jgi:YD repeat-containing protein
VRYKYDGAGRLIEAAESSGAVHRYSYTTSDLLATMQEPDTTIENTYENERCIRQVNRYPDTPVPYVFEFSYTMNGNAVVQTDSHQSDGTWKRYTFDATSAATSEIWGADGASVVTIEYQRDPVSRLVTSLTVTCPDRSGHLLSHSSAATRGEEWTKWDLLRTHCAPQGYFHREP